MRLLLVLVGLLVPTPVSAQCAHVSGPQHLTVSSAAPLSGHLVYCAKTEAERNATPYLFINGGVPINGNVPIALEHTCPGPAPVDCVAVFPVAMLQQLSTEVGRRHQVWLMLRSGTTSGPFGAPFSVETEASEGQPVPPLACLYSAPGSTAVVQVPHGTAKTGHNALDPDSQFDRDKIAARLLQLRKWGFQVDTYMNFPAKKILLLAVCMGVPQ